MSRLSAHFAKQLKPAHQGSVSQPQGGNGVQDALRRAAEHFGKGEFRQAEQLCTAILAREPKNVQALVLGGSLARAAGNAGLAIAFFKEVVALQPNSVEGRLGLAAAYGKAHQYEDAIGHLRHVLALKPDFAPALGALGKSYMAVGQAELALPLFEKATKLQPSHAALRLDHANALIALGRMDDAAILLNDNIARGYRVASSYKALVDTQKFSSEPPELGAIVDNLDKPSLTPQERAVLHDAAGKILNDIGRYDEAIDHFQASKTASGRGFDVDAYRRRVDTLVAAFTPELLKAKDGFGNPSEVPVFIVGMPRSGTTLTEQICASHPAVHGAGELFKLRTVVQSAGYAPAPDGSFPRPPQAMTASEATSMAADYLAFIQSKSPSARIVDKMPHNFQLIGMIALLFPNAKIIHCTRDPIDNCISCFLNTFNDNHGYNADFRTLGLYYREYKRLMQHWNALLPGRIYECNYETMIEDQEAESRRLIDFLGLPWDDACLRYYDTDRSVTTLSRWQVRQPIYKSSVKRWKKYENKIQPLIEALGDLADV